MKEIWYLLKCPKEDIADYVKEYQEAVEVEREDSLQEMVYFQYQRLLRYGGQWHLENKELLPGYVFFHGTENAVRNRQIPLSPCEISSLKKLCPKGNLVEMSRGIIQNGIPVITRGPLRGREQLIRKIDRHKRIAEIGIILEGQEKRVTVGLEIYEKQM